jgi:hypothetical protein
MCLSRLYVDIIEGACNAKQYIKKLDYRAYDARDDEAGFPLSAFAKASADRSRE